MRKLVVVFVFRFQSLHRLLCGLAWLVFVLPARSSDFGTWYGVSLKTLDTQHVDLVTLGQIRLYNDSQDLLLYSVSQKVVVDVNRYLQTGINYTFIPTRLDVSDPFTRQHRLELELTPRWPVNDRLTLDFRNRLELRWFEGVSGPRERSRHRLNARYRVNETGLLQTLFAGNEVFFDYTTTEITQNRLLPLGAAWRLNGHVTLECYYLFQSIRSRNDWNNAHIIGTGISFSL